MALFRDEAPVLGQAIQVKELSGYGAGNPVTNYFKPTTRELVDVTMQAAGQHVTQWIYQAPWKCQVVAIHENHTVASTSGTIDVVRIQADGIAPAAANGTTIISMLTAPMSTAGAANTRQNLALSTASGNPLILNAGDQLAVVAGGSSVNYAGGVVQIEITQLG
jgi:hypothetical protein